MRHARPPFDLQALPDETRARSAALARRAASTAPPLPAIRMAVLISRKAASVDTATLLARVAILSLSAVACLAVVAQALLLPSTSGSRVELTPTPPFGEAGGAPTPPPSRSSPSRRRRTPSSSR